MQKYLRIRPPKLTTQKCNINGVKLKLYFDTRKNVSAFDKFYSRLRLEDIKHIIKVTKNWYEIILFRLGIKRKIDIVLKNGSKFRVNNYDDYNYFWELGQLLLNNNVKIDKKGAW